MAKKTNKTAHVLSLISKAKETYQEDDDDVEIETIDSRVTPDLSFVDLQLAHDTELSEKIKETLTQEDQSEQVQPAEEPQSALEKVVIDAAKSVVEEENPVVEDEVSRENEDNTEKEQDSYVVQSKRKEVQVEPLPKLDVAENVKKQEETTEPASEEAKKDGERFYYVNVLEEIVKERVETYMRRFGVCMCPRCVADTTALALNGLPPKYVVIDKKSGSPMFNYLEMQYAGAVVTQLSQACVIVKNQPNHE